MTTLQRILRQLEAGEAISNSDGWVLWYAKEAEKKDATGAGVLARPTNRQDTLDGDRDRADHR